MDKKCDAKVLPSGVFAVIGFGKNGWRSFFSPYLVSRSPGIFFEPVVAFRKVTVYRLLRFFDCGIVAVVNDRPSHAAEDRLDDVQKLRARG